MHTIKSLGVVFFMLFMSVSAAAQADTFCNKAELEVIPFSHAVRSDLSARKITEEQLKGAYNFGSGGLGLGMVITQQDIRIFVDKDEATGCRVFHVKAGFAPATLYVANELLESLCAYRHIYNHEMEHIQIYQRFVAQLAAPMQQAIDAELASSQEPSTKVLGEKLYEVAGEVASRVRAQHNALDSDDTYARNERVCRGILMNIGKGA